jgi:hypothetical protein
MNDVIVIKRRRNWEWQVRDQNGELIMGGRERTRPAARYQGYRTLFMMLAAGRRFADVRTLKPSRLDQSRPDQTGLDRSDAGTGTLRFNWVRPKTGQSR